ncbi:MAG: crossover junction endodeoxyribonuclease RuvC [Candidatus Kaiserbacteria bacterium]|nr:crossover junction endodeoxyribonuclease RuvC [Candidatus Kaiserbacteria bacterium]
MKVLAIDPGYGRIGFAVLLKEGGKTNLLFSECFETEKETVFEERLKKIGDRIRDIAQAHQPDCAAIERLFFSKNKKTALQTAEVRGVCIYTTKEYNLTIAEYTPNQVKNAITGNSNATKSDVIRMVPRLITLDSRKRHDDEYDAIAIGITHLVSVPYLAQQQ